MRTTTTPVRRHVPRLRSVFGAIAAAATLWIHASHAQTYPDKPIRLIVPFAAGTTTDLLARQISDKLGDELKQRFIVENRAGAGGTLGTAAAARAPADGYTLLFGTGQTQSVNVSLYKNAAYDPLKDFAPIAKIGSQPLVLVVNPTLPVKSVADLVAYAKQRPNDVSFASTGSGSSGHLGGSAFNQAAKLQLVHVPYNSNQLFADLISGRISLLFYPYAPLREYIASGKLVALATAGTTRLPELPNLPTMIESGFPEVVFAPWYALYAPAGTPAPIVQTLTAAVKKVLDDPDLHKRLANTGTLLEFQGPDALTAYTQSEINRMREIVRISGASEN
jgi:tripartite-type tricarboxylate transporter receptor subunit TctC